MRLTWNPAKEGRRVLNMSQFISSEADSGLIRGCVCILQGEIDGIQPDRFALELYIETGLVYPLKPPYILKKTSIGSKKKR